MDKRELGQFFTVSDIWLKPHILEFIKQSEGVVVDPFCGDGDLLKLAGELGFTECVGYDMDVKGNAIYNDSLVSIPQIDKGLILTNPPYLSKITAIKRFPEMMKYFKDVSYTDIYLVALEKMLCACERVVAIIPEAFLRHPQFKERLYSITIIEDNPFVDTEHPVCVVCFDNEYKDLCDVLVYKNDHFVSSLFNLLECKKCPTNCYPICFDTEDGDIVVRSIDDRNGEYKIRFVHIRDSKWIKHEILEESTIMYLVKIDSDFDTDTIINKANKMLEDYRVKTQDLLLTPFKGNDVKNIRRRRMTKSVAHAILEDVMCELYRG